MEAMDVRLHTTTAQKSMEPKDAFKKMIVGLADIETSARAHKKPACGVGLTIGP